MNDSTREFIERHFKSDDPYMISLKDVPYVRIPFSLFGNHLNKRNIYKLRGFNVRKHLKNRRDSHV